MSPTNLLQLPSDLQHLIWGQLKPRDLLALAQTCRTISADLSQPQGVAVWGEIKVHFTNLDRNTAATCEAALAGRDLPFFVAEDLTRAAIAQRHADLFAWLHRRSRGIRRVSVQLDLGLQCDGIGTHVHVLNHLLPQLSAGWQGGRGPCTMPLQMSLVGGGPWAAAPFYRDVLLEKLRGLNQLSIDSDDINHGTFEELCEISELTALDLSSSRFNDESRGSLIGAMPAAISRLAKLEALSLFAHVFLTTLPPELTKLTRLSSLSCKAHGLLRVPAFLSSLSRLHTLDISENYYGVHGETMSPFVIEAEALNGPSLQHASFESCDLAPQQVLQSVTLRELAMTTVRLRPVLGRMPQLTRLDLSTEGESDGAVMWQGLDTLTSLKELSLDAANVQLQSGCSNLARLSALSLGCTKLAGVPEVIASLAQLRKLALTFRFSNGHVATMPFQPTTLDRLHTLRRLAQLDVLFGLCNWFCLPVHAAGQGDCNMDPMWRQAVRGIIAACPDCAVGCWGCGVMKAS